MNRFTIVVAVAAISISVCSAARAEVFTPAQIIQPKQSSIENRVTDVLGFKTGMAVTEVMAKYKSLRGAELNAEETSIAARIDGVSLETTPYIASLNNIIDNDDMREELSFSFSGPASGNQLVWIHRNVTYKEMSAPSPDNVFSSLLDKYGEPTSKGTLGFTTFGWTFKDGQAHRSNCMLWEAGYRLNMIAAYSDGQFSNCGDFSMFTGVSTGGSGTVYSIDTTVTDYQKVRESGVADWGSILEKAEEIRSANYSPAEVQF